MPRVSVICIALSPREFEPLQRKLAAQTWHDFEFVGEVGGTIPEAWNRAIARAQGDILVFTETDAVPVYNTWLEELVASVLDDKTIVKGLEITGSTLDLANLACYRTAFTNASFDEEFRWAEDTELFCQWKTQGFRFIEIPRAPVIHPRKIANKRMIRRAFRYGVYNARLAHRYSDPVQLGEIGMQVRLILMGVLNLLGYLWGWLIYWPEQQRQARHALANRRDTDVHRASPTS
ncbi:MAG: hypothetical protein U0641_03235 [Anaerolineae bacterium]